MLGTIPIELVEPLQDLDLPLIEGLLFGLKFIFKALNSVVLAGLDVPTFVDMAETATANELLLLELIPKDSLPFGRGAHCGTLMMSQLHCVPWLETHRCALMLHKLL